MGYTNCVRAQNDYFTEYPIPCFLDVKLVFLPIYGDIPPYDTWQTAWPQAEVQQYGKGHLNPGEFFRTVLTNGTIWFEFNKTKPLYADGFEFILL